MSQAAATHAPVALKGRHNDTSEDKLSYLLGFLMGGLVTKGFCHLDKEELKRMIGAKRMSREVYETVHRFIPDKVKGDDIRLLDQGSSLTLIDVNKLTSFSERLTSGEA